MSSDGTMPSWSPAPAAGVTLPSPPVPGGTDDPDARQIGARIGTVYGQFRAWLENFLDMFNTTALMGGKSLWDSSSPELRLKAIADVQRVYQSLPTLPLAATPALATAMRLGFADAAKASYEADLFMNRCVWAACELAKAFAIGKASTPAQSAIAGFSDKFSDCAAQTAARAILEMSGVEVEASYLVRTFGLPRASIDGFDAAVAYSRNWFTNVGLKLASTPGGLAPVAQGGVIGRYVVFLKGGASGGHVIFADLTRGGMQLIDPQLGTMWSNVASAERALGMQVITTSRIESITLPF